MAFDLAVSNIPFGDIAVPAFDAEFQRATLSVNAPPQKTIHSYFFLKGLDAVRDGGGIAAFILAGVLNNTKTSVRNRLFQSGQSGIRDTVAQQPVHGQRGHGVGGIGDLSCPAKEPQQEGNVAGRGYDDRDTGETRKPPDRQRPISSTTWNASRAYDGETTRTLREEARYGFICTREQGGEHRRGFAMLDDISITGLPCALFGFNPAGRNGRKSCRSK